MTTASASPTATNGFRNHGRRQQPLVNELLSCSSAEPCDDPTHECSSPVRPTQDRRVKLVESFTGVRESEPMRNRPNTTTSATIRSPRLIVAVVTVLTGAGSVAAPPLVRRDQRPCAGAATHGDSYRHASTDPDTHVKFNADGNAAR